MFYNCSIAFYQFSTLVATTIRYKNATKSNGNIEENQPDKPASTEIINMQEMMRLMAEQMNKSIEALSQKIEDNSKRWKTIKKH